MEAADCRVDKSSTRFSSFQLKQSILRSAEVLQIEGVFTLNAENEKT